MVFNRMKTRGMLPGESGNLNAVPSTDTFLQTMSSINRDSVMSMTQKEKSKAVNAAKNDIEKLYEDDKWLVISPNSKEASMYWGNHTKWCTATREDKNMFEHYNKQGKLIININKQTKEKFQFHFPNREYRDEENNAIFGPILENIGDVTEGLYEFYNEITQNDEINHNLLFKWNVEGEEMKINDKLSVKELTVDDKQTFIDDKFNPLEDIYFDSIVNCYYNYGFAVVEYKGKAYLYNFNKFLETGHGLIETDFDEIYDFTQTLGFMSQNIDNFFAIVEKDGKYNLINGKGKILSPDLWFEEIDEDWWGSGYARCLAGEQLVVVDKHGKVMKF